MVVKVKTREEYGFLPFVSAQPDLQWRSPNNLLSGGWTLGLRDAAPPSQLTLCTDKVIATLEFLLRENAILHERVNALTELTRVLVSVAQDNVKTSPSLLVHPDNEIRDMVRSTVNEVITRYSVGEWS